MFCLWYWCGVGEHGSNSRRAPDPRRITVPSKHLSFWIYPFLNCLVKCSRILVGFSPSWKRNSILRCATGIGTSCSDIVTTDARMNKQCHSTASAPDISAQYLKKGRPLNFSIACAWPWVSLIFDSTFYKEGFSYFFASSELNINQICISLFNLRRFLLILQHVCLFGTYLRELIIFLRTLIWNCCMIGLNGHLVQAHSWLH